jgi:glycosyltransferase involved in cell wall biosynthesis
MPGSSAVLRAVSVLRLAPRKRVLPLLQLAAAASKSAPVELTIIGEGPVRRRAQAMAERLGLRARFTGRLGASEIRGVFSQSDVFVQPSVRESFGLAALEARSAGLPVVARSQTGTVDFIRNGVEGLLANDDAGMAAALVRLSRDEGLRAAIASHNLSTTPAEDWPNVLDQVDAAYARIQSRSRP